VIPGSAGEILRRLGAPQVEPLRLDRDAVIQTAGERAMLRKDALWPRIEAEETAGATADVPGKEPQPVTDQPKPDVAAPAQAPAAGSPGPAPPPAAAAQPAAAPGADRISIDEFMKIELRVARVITAERVPNSKKLMKMTIDVGSEQRTIVAGIAEAYEADSLVGRHVAIVFNLKPAKLMGIESNGMVLAASPEGGKPILVSFDTPPAPGTRVR
jgi:methionyl-tRNA synthetase